MKKILVVVDMQNDFITGPLGTPEAVSIVDKVVEKIRGEEWHHVYYTADTHDNDDYLNTQEGKMLPVPHCIEYTYGWKINSKVMDAINSIHSTKRDVRYKNTFGSIYLASWMFNTEKVSRNFEVTFVGVCTDICVISNALLLKAHYPEMKIVVDASCCAGTTPEKHRMALEVMKSCQVDITNEE